jgi:tetraacyldisaccharide 4'-kinase
MNPLSALYAAISGGRNLLYDSGWFSGRLQGPVISVGSLSAGGAGKTPFLILLGELLRSRAVSFDVLSRGYGRKTRGVRLVDAAGTAEEFGDEPVYISRRLQVPVVVGEDRYQAGEFAEHKFGPRVHLLDDAFQHRSLARDFEIVLLPFGDTEDRLFPMGRLREPLASLRRADAVVIFDELSASRVPAGKMIWRVRRGIRIGEAPPGQVAFCGIARPWNFFRDLQDAGLEPAAELAFPDHHCYNDKDIRNLLRAREEKRTAGFVTTEKDSVNLGPRQATLQPLWTIAVRMELEQEEAQLNSMLATIALRRAGGRETIGKNIR